MAGIFKNEANDYEGIGSSASPYRELEGKRSSVRGFFWLMVSHAFMVQGSQEAALGSGEYSTINKFRAVQLHLSCFSWRQVAAKKFPHVFHRIMGLDHGLTQNGEALHLQIT
jgi:hypothetical protein